MELTLDEIFFVKNAVGQCQIKASDAPSVASLIMKLEKEFSRIQQAQEKSQAQSSRPTAKASK